MTRSLSLFSNAFCLISNKSSLNCHLPPQRRKLISRPVIKTTFAFRRQKSTKFSLRTVHTQFHAHPYLWCGKASLAPGNGQAGKKVEVFQILTPTALGFLDTSLILWVSFPQEVQQDNGKMLRTSGLMRRIKCHMPFLVQNTWLSHLWVVPC